MLPAWLRSDLAVYLVSGLFSVVVFVAAIGVLDLSPGSRGFWSFTVGFLLFVFVYFVSLLIYLEIDRRES